LMLCCCSFVASAVGYIVIFGFVLKVLLEFYKRFLRPACNLSKYGADKQKTSRSWAAVTGASDGIGKAFAKELGKRGFNVLLLSRTESKLIEVGKDIEQQCGVKTDYMAVDFSSTDPSLYEAIADKISSLKVGVLVNNVGVNLSYPDQFLNTDAAINDKILNVNIRAALEMTRVVLPSMVSNGGGGIINLGSLSGMVPTPMLSTYSGGKAFLKYFSLCIDREYKDKGIDSMIITPALVVSNMSKIRRTSLFVSSPEVIAKSTLDNLGREVVWCPALMHSIQEWVMRILPRDMIIKQVHRVNLTTKKRALRKIERELKQS